MNNYNQLSSALLFLMLPKTSKCVPSFVLSFGLKMSWFSLMVTILIIYIVLSIDNPCMKSFVSDNALHSWLKVARYQKQMKSLLVYLISKSDA